jgi:zinc transport system substrate-binding protein
MGDRGTPELLLQGRLSEHTASLTPHQVAALGRADIVFTIGHGLEYSIGQLDGSEAVNGKHFVHLELAPGIALLPIREGAAWEPDTDEPAPPAATDANGLVLKADPHIWTDPANAAAMARAVAAELAKADPDGADIYRRNAEAFAAALTQLSNSIADELRPVQAQRFIVFHDAYHYFERRFGLNAAGSISDVSAANPSAARLKAIRDRLIATQAACVFREPQFDDKYVRTITEGTPARIGVLDGLGADLAPGPDAYGQLLRNLAASFKSCLSG